MPKNGHFKAEGLNIGWVEKIRNNRNFRIIGQGKGGWEICFKILAMRLVIFFILMFLGLGYAQTPQKVYETKLVIATKFGDKKFTEIADKKAVENAKALGEAIVPF
jgi:hypothetical protein